jgi:galactose mutarotase-like enzyme
MSHQIKKYFEDNTEIVELKNETLVAKIAVNIGNTLYSLQKEKEEKLYFPFTFDEYKTNAKLAGNPFMHPWANRLEHEAIILQDESYLFPENKKHLLYRDGNNLPLHGLLLKSDQWKTIEIYETANKCTHVAEFVFDNEDLLSIFPFKHSIQIKHTLQENELTIETTVINNDEMQMPISFGFHPYFLKTKNNYQLKIPTDDVVEVNNIMIPTGNTFNKSKKWDFNNDEISLNENAFDDGFQQLKFENHVATFELNEIKILFDKYYPFAQIYAPKHDAKPYVCIEPMTAITNAMNTNSCQLIKQYESYTATFSIVL